MTGRESGSVAGRDVPGSGTVPLSGCRVGVLLNELEVLGASRRHRVPGRLVCQVTRRRLTANPSPKQIFHFSNYRREQLSQE